jgi:translocation and assembly module TamB
MRRGLKIVLIAVGSLSGLVLLSLAFLLFTGPGNKLIEPIVAWSSDGQIQIAGLSGNLPNVLHAEMIEVNDVNGVWLRLEDVSLEWDALSALQSRFTIHAVSAAKISVLRKPEMEKSEGGKTPEIDIGYLNLPRIEIGAPVSGHAATLSARGSIQYFSRHQLKADVDIRQTDGAGHYRVNGEIVSDVVQGSASVSEDTHGILGAILGLPGLGAINLSATASKHRTSNRIAMALTAGALKANGSGTIALAQNRAAIDFTTSAPAMQPSGDIGWKSLSLDGHLHGSFDAPSVKAHLTAADVTIAGVQIAALNAQLAGSGGALNLTGTANALRIPGDHSDLFAAAPVAVTAHADLRLPAKNVTFKVLHPLLLAEGVLKFGETSTLTTAVTLPSLEPFARLADEDLRGHASVKIDAEQREDQSELTVTGQIAAQGTSRVAGVLGENAIFVIHGTTRGAEIVKSDAKIVGTALDFRASGALRAKRIEYGINVKLSDVSKLVPALIGSATLAGRIQGPLDAATAEISGDATLASPGFKPQRINLRAQAKGFPRFSSGQLRVGGSLNGAPVSLHANLARSGEKLTASGAMTWKSLRANGELVFPAKQEPTGKAKLDIGQLTDIAPLLAKELKGSLTSTVMLDARGSKSVATLRAQASQANFSNVQVGTTTLSGTVTDPFGAPSVALLLSAQHVSLGDISGGVNATLAGPLHNLGITTNALLNDSSDQRARFSASGHLDTAKQRLALEQLTAQWHGQTAALAAPAAIDFAQGLKVDRIAVHVGGGEMRLSGQITPALNASATANGLNAKILEPFVATPLEGTLSANATLNGTLDEPKGRVAIHAHNIVARAYLPGMPVNLDAQGSLHGKGAMLDARLSAGSAQLTFKGEAPFGTGEPMNIRAHGNADLAFLDAFLASEGRRIHGVLSLDVDIAGTPAAPRLSGSGTLKSGELQDYVLGAHLKNIDAVFAGAGQSLRITKLSARAGSGTIDGSGQIDFGSSGFPLDVTLHFQKARPVVSDRLTAIVSGDIHLSGKLSQALVVAGKLDTSRATINIPDRFPPEVAVLDVRRKDQKPQAAAQGGSVALDIAVSTSGPIFIRGRGIDADMGGSIRLGGSINAPLATGNFDMNRGTLSLAGQTLTFTTGKLSFDGGGLRNGIDPFLNLIAQTSSGGVTATLTVTGHASKPQIVLSSAPSLPQDEVLAHLFFQQGAKQLTALQLAQIAQAIASLGGIGTGFDPLGALRKELRLDRLSVGSTSGGASGSDAQTTIEAGKYIARNVYVGAQQSLSGGTQVQVQVDLTKQLKAQATVSNGANATSAIGSAAQNNSGSVGLSYGFEY